MLWNEIAYNRGFPVVQDPTSVASFLAGVSHAGIVSAALETNREEVAFRVVVTVS